MTFWTLSVTLWSLVIATVSTTACITLLLRRRDPESKRKPWLKPMLDQMAHADSVKGKLNPTRLGIIKP